MRARARQPLLALLLGSLLCPITARGADAGSGLAATVEIELFDEDSGALLDGSVTLFDRSGERPAVRTAEGLYVGTATGASVRIAAEAAGYPSFILDFGVSGNPARLPGVNYISPSATIRLPHSGFH
jgi:hypothetical protein